MGELASRAVLSSPGRGAVEILRHGQVLILDLKLRGVWRPSAAYPSDCERCRPMAVAGFALAATSGACLIASNAR